MYIAGCGPIRWFSLYCGLLRTWLDQNRSRQWHIYKAAGVLNCIGLSTKIISLACQFITILIIGRKDFFTHNGSSIHMLFLCPSDRTRNCCVIVWVIICKIEWLVWKFWVLLMMQFEGSLWYIQYEYIRHFSNIEYIK